jgi:hypothetical protein
MLLHDLFVKSWVPGVLLWSALYGARQLLTATNSRLYRGGARDVFEWAGSVGADIEQTDAVRLRWYRVYSAITLLGIALLLAIVWIYSHELVFWKSLYFAVLGSCTLPLCTTNLRYLNNYFIFRGTRDERLITGKVSFSEIFARQASSMGLFSFAGLYLMLALVLGDWFCLGGTLGCLLAALRENERRQELERKAHEVQ